MLSSLECAQYNLGQTPSDDKNRVIARDRKGGVRHVILRRFGIGITHNSFCSGEPSALSVNAKSSLPDFTDRDSGYTDTGVGWNDVSAISKRVTGPPFACES